jgi:hypothetical protein
MLWPLDSPDCWLIEMLLAVGKYLNDYALPGSPGCTKNTPDACATPPPGAPPSNTAAPHWANSVWDWIGWDYWLGLFGNSKVGS